MPMNSVADTNFKWIYLNIVYIWMNKYRASQMQTCNYFCLVFLRIYTGLT